MSFDSSQILTVIKAISDKVALASNIDFVFPTATRFADKADYWAFVDAANDTRDEIETELIRAAWLSYLRFEDSDTEQEAPVKTITYQLAVFHEASFERLDETASPNAFNQKVALTDHEHDTAVFALQTEFQGLTPVTISGFPSIDITSIVQTDDTDRAAEIPFVSGTTGSLTILEITVQVLVPC